MKIKSFTSLLTASVVLTTNFSTVSLTTSKALAEDSTPQGCSITGCGQSGQIRKIRTTPTPKTPTTKIFSTRWEGIDGNGIQVFFIKTSNKYWMKYRNFGTGTDEELYEYEEVERTPNYITLHSGRGNEYVQLHKDGRLLWKATQMRDWFPEVGSGQWR